MAAAAQRLWGPGEHQDKQPSFYGPHLNCSCITVRAHSPETSIPVAYNRNTIRQRSTYRLLYFGLRRMQMAWIIAVVGKVNAMIV